ncbi:hypothetical protein HMI54_010954 [Coelomomyces lativittatus]|nr:hypothetical protein HMI54_010954 [Coelomomyces lativittatus]
MLEPGAKKAILATTISGNTILPPTAGHRKLTSADRAEGMQSGFPLAVRADFKGPGRINATGFSIGSKGYLGTGAGQGYYKDFWEYDPSSNTWTQKADFGGGERYTPVGFSIGAKGYIGVGFFDLKDFWEYDPASNGWTRKADFGGTGRAYAVGFSIGNRGYIGTGVYPVGYKDFWEYTPGNSCAAPTGLKLLHVSDTCAVLSCNSTDDVSILQVRYRAQGDIAWMKQRKNPDRNRIYINDLMPNTTYEWQVRSFCTDNTSDWVKGPDFTTDASLQPITKSVVYPNPAKNVVTIDYTASKNGQYIFEITNLIGRILSRKEINAPQGFNRTSLDVSQLIQGVYFINIIKPDKTREKIQLRKE